MNLPSLPNELAIIIFKLILNKSITSNKAINNKLLQQIINIKLTSKFFNDYFTNNSFYLQFATTTTLTNEGIVDVSTNNSKFVINKSIKNSFVLYQVKTQKGVNETVNIMDSGYLKVTNKAGLVKIYNFNCEEIYSNQDCVDI